MTPIIHEIATGFLKNILETLKTSRAYEMGRDQCKAYEVLQGNDRQVHRTGLDNDPKKIGINMLEMLAKFRNEGIVE